MVIVKSGLSVKLQSLLIEWVKEDQINIEHDINDTLAWNALVKHLMELEQLTEGLVCE